MAPKRQPTVEDYDLRNPTMPAESDRSKRFDLDKAPTVATGLGIRQGEKDAIDTISRELGITKNAFMRWCLRYVITELEAGRLDLEKWTDTPPEPKKTLRMPG